MERAKQKKKYVQVGRNHIKERLLELDMTQQELADNVEISRHHLSRIANNHSKNITVAVALKIAKYLDKSVEELFEL
jgi:addiction module HigA family antidote